MYIIVNTSTKMVVLYVPHEHSNIIYQDSTLDLRDPGFIRAVSGSISKGNGKSYTGIPASVFTFYVNTCLNIKVSIGFLRKLFCCLKTSQKQNKTNISMHIFTS